MYQPVTDVTLTLHRNDCHLGLKLQGIINIKVWLATRQYNTQS